jgi:NAD(P)-dependent dehydrogenase (short-subunit alcohol dehydrogenase family)
MSGKADLTTGDTDITLYNVQELRRKDYNYICVKKIRVNSISPGPVETPGLRQALQSAQDVEKLITTYLNTIPLGRFDNPDDIANALSFLASNDSSFVTGIELCVDGGMGQI